MAQLSAILIFLLIGGLLGFWGTRLQGKASQFVTMTIYSAAILFCIAALATLTFFNLSGHT